MLLDDSIVFNGKFLTNDLTGVHRVAFELIKACSQLHEQSDNNSKAMGIAMPANGPLPCWQIDRTLADFSITRGSLRGHAWEQFELPWRTRGRILINLCNLAPVLKKNSITMVHDAHIFNAPSSYPLRFRMAYRASIPQIGRIHSNIVTVSEFSKSELIKWGIAKAEKINVIHNGVDHMLRFDPDRNTLHKLGLAGQKYVVGISSDQPHKNIGLLLKAFDDPRLKEIKCVLIGRDRRVDFSRAGYPVGENIVFSGVLRDEELRALLEGSIATVCPSTTEGFGLLPLEGMVLGCPTIVSRRGSLPEVCGSAAVYEEPDDVQGWVASIESFCRREEHRASFGALGRTQAEKFTWSEAARRLLDLCARMTKATARSEAH